MSYKIVEDAAVWQDMAGITPLHQKINSFLTCTFIIRRGIPDDECVSYAQPLIDLWNKDSSLFVDKAAACLDHYFCTQDPAHRHQCPHLPILPGAVEDLAEMLARELQ